MADDAQRDLDEALPALEAATASLKNLSRNDVVEVKSLSNPPAGVKLVMEVSPPLLGGYADLSHGQCHAGACHVCDDWVLSAVLSKIMLFVGMLHHV